MPKEDTQFKKGSKRPRESGRRGGSARTPAKKMGQRLRKIREIYEAGGDISKHAPFVFKLATDQQFAATDLMSRALQLIDEIQNDVEVDNEIKIKVLNTYNNIYRSIHKKYTQLTQVNINMNQEVEKEMEEFLEQNVGDDGNIIDVDAKTAKE